MPRQLRNQSMTQPNDEPLSQFELESAYVVENLPGQYDILVGSGSNGIASGFPTRNAAHSWLCRLRRSAYPPGYCWMGAQCRRRISPCAGAVPSEIVEITLSAAGGGLK
jgi:hypothetical protein